MRLDLTTHLSGAINVTLHSSQVNIEPTYVDVTWKSMDTNIVDIKVVTIQKWQSLKLKEEELRQ